MVTNTQGANQDYVPGLANRLTDDGRYLYEYDNEGNLKKLIYKINPLATREYTWDHRNRLVQIEDKYGSTSQGRTSYTYDAQGRRVRRSIDLDGNGPQPATHDYYVYDGDELSMTFNHSGQLTHRFLYGPAADQVLVDEVFNAAGQSTERLWLFADQQGTIRDVLDNAGVLRKHVDYDSFGNITGEQFFSKAGASITSSHAEAVDQAFAYTGQERDEDTGLYNYDARWYLPNLGRFLSEDPSSFDGGDLNLYRYVHNNPVIYVDPTGLSQAGNPLTNLFGGTTVNPYALSLANSGSPIITQPRPSSSPGLSLGTLGSALGNSVINAAPSLLFPGANVARGTANAASSIALTGGFFGDTFDAVTGYARGLKNSVDRTVRSAYDGVAYALEHPLGAVGSVASGVESVLHTGLDYTIGWGLEYKRNQNLRSIENKYDALQNEYNRLKDASVYEQAEAIGDVVGTVAQLFVPATRATRATSAFRPLAIIDDVVPNTVVQRTNAQLVGDIATRAERKVGGTGSAAGIAKHGYADDLLTRYQRIYGDRGLSTEVRYLNGQVWEPGMGLRGTVRLDVVQGAREAPTAVFDYKFGGATLSPARVNQLQSGARLGPSVPIYQVKP